MQLTKAFTLLMTLTLSLNAQAGYIQCSNGSSPSDSIYMLKNSLVASNTHQKVSAISMIQEPNGLYLACAVVN